ncbi:MAG: glycosyltransferase, partial [Ignavibacteriales bacterium]|nr:glycosyltransferase [Ignavibacteriales bacterium]
MAEIVFICLSLIAIHYFWFLLDILRGLFRLKIEKNKIIADEFISILIPFRNEADNSLSCLKSLESQNFPKDKFEIIFIDDNSTDDSVKIILQNKKNKNVKIISAEETDDNFGHKKRAIQKGIDNSLGEIIVTTDADCIHNPNWLKS